MTQPPTITSTPETDRIERLDLLRGVATLGIFAMNSLSFTYVDAAYYNLTAAGVAGWWDVVVGLAGKVVFDQKMMGLFSLLFGASLAMFVERASRKTAHPRRLAAWRNALLLGLGLVHAAAWEGDVLTVYALLAPVVLATLHLPPRRLLVAGVSLFVASAAAAAWTQGFVDPSAREGLAWWLPSHDTYGDGVLTFFLLDAFARALGMMWIGVATYRMGVFTGAVDRRGFRRWAVVGLGVGVPLAGVAVARLVASDFGVSSALSVHAWNTLATLPMTLGYVGSIGWAGGGRLTPRLVAVGRMALSNYLAQTVVGLVVLGAVVSEVFGPGGLSRTGVAAVVVAVWAAQLVISPWWLARYRYGPVEWVWRVATYRRAMPLRRRPVD